jgi:hypothetical protein
MKTTKKLLAVVLAVMMVVAMVPATVAFASTSVSTLANLKTAFTNGGDVVLGSNITVNSTISIPTGKTVTLDLNGKTLNETKNYAIENYGTLTIKGEGKLTTGRGCVDNYGTLNVEGGTYVATDSTGGAALFNENSSSVINFNAGTIEAASIGISNYGSGTVVINGGKISNESYDYALIFNNAKGTVKINDGEVTAKYIAVKNPSGGSVVVNGGTVHSDKLAAIQNSNGTATINGGVVSSNCSSKTNTKAEGYQYTLVNCGTLVINEGATITGVHGAVNVEDGSATINGGTITVANSDNGGNDAFYPLYVTACSGDVSCTVKGGTFINNGARTVVDVDGSGNEANGNGDINVTISGGTFEATDGVQAIISNNKSGKGLVCDVTGGLYTSDVRQYVPNGYTTVKTTVDNKAYYAVTPDTAEAVADVEMTADTDDDFGQKYQFNKSLELCGIEKKLDNTTNDMRFVSVINSELIENATDYGYIIGATSTDKAEAMSEAAKITIENASKFMVSCKETSNQLSGDYGKCESETNYKYVTAAVENITNTSKTIFARVYVTLEDGTTLYGKYINFSGVEYNGCASSYADLG